MSKVPYNRNPYVPSEWDDIDDITGAYETDITIHWQRNHCGSARKQFIETKLANFINNNAYGVRTAYNGYRDEEVEWDDQDYSFIDDITELREYTPYGRKKA